MYDYDFSNRSSLNKTYEESAGASDPKNRAALIKDFHKQN